MYTSPYSWMDSLIVIVRDFGLYLWPVSNTYDFEQICLIFIYENNPANNRVLLPFLMPNLYFKAFNIRYVILHIVYTLMHSYGTVPKCLQIKAGIRIVNLLLGQLKRKEHNFLTMTQDDKVDHSPSVVWYNTLVVTFAFEEEVTTCCKVYR